MAILFSCSCHAYFLKVVALCIHSMPISTLDHIASLEIVPMTYFSKFAMAKMSCLFAMANLGFFNMPTTIFYAFVSYLTTTNLVC